jgi:hypothetical protein
LRLPSSNRHARLQQAQHLALHLEARVAQAALDIRPEVQGGLYVGLAHC